ncbi:unnamed protein product [Amoebophrya sp. A25]|nr:unnamed protein product [Amoebophrya sp. A25]|eukprot:GSA25T00025174001.1
MGGSALGADSTSALEDMTKEDLVHYLQLQPHPEGGFFKETWRSEVGLSNGGQVCGTAISFLLDRDDRSHLHVLKGGNDEVWHHYGGATLEVVEIDPEDGKLTITRLGKNVLAGETPQYVVKAGKIFGSRVLACSTSNASSDRTSWALVGCTVCPGFEFADFEILDRVALLERFPQHEKTILDLTRG